MVMSLLMDFQEKSFKVSKKLSFFEDITRVA